MTEAPDLMTRFEDMEDMLDFISSKIEDAAYWWALYCKISLGCSCQRVAEEMLIELVSKNFNNIYPKLIPYLQYEKNGIKISGVLFNDPD